MTGGGATAQLPLSPPLLPSPTYVLLLLRTGKGGGTPKVPSSLVCLRTFLRSGIRGGGIGDVSTCLCGRVYVYVFGSLRTPSVTVAGGDLPFSNSSPSVVLTFLRFNFGLKVQFFKSFCLASSSFLF